MISTNKGGKFKFFPDQTLLDLRIFICSTTYRNGPWVCANNTLGHDRTNSILNIRKKQGEKSGKTEGGTRKSVDGTVKNEE